MKIKITGGVLEAEIQGNPLKNIQEQLSAISQDTTTRITKLKSIIEEVTKIKDKSVSDLYEEFHARDIIIETELDELRTMIEALSKPKSSYLNDEKYNSIMDKLRSMAGDTKDIINGINSKIDKLAKDKTESIARLQSELVRIKQEDDRRLSILRKQFSNIPDIKPVVETTKIKVVKQGGSELIDTSRAKVSPHSSKSDMQDKLNAKPRMPI